MEKQALPAFTFPFSLSLCLSLFSSLLSLPANFIHQPTGYQGLEEEEREGWAHGGVFFQGELDRVHVAPGAKIRSCTINTENGDVMLGLDSEIMEGSNIRGPFVLGAFSKLKMGSQIYGPTTIGAHCKIGGELNNVVIHDYTNKAHGGFLGNSVLGSWCNLGAGTVSSNLKNTYGEVEVWSKSERSMVKKEALTLLTSKATHTS